jgi:cbb3-type cytochrome oxidase cytochrome c subunit
MKGLYPLLAGLFATFAFSWLGLAVIPNFQIGHLDPQSDEEGTDIYPMPQSGMAERGRKVYTANGCVYCHSQQIRPEYAASDIDRERDAAPSPRPKWAERRSAPRDYIFSRPVVLGKMRMGPDLADIGKAAPAEDQGAAAPGGSPVGSPNASPAGSPAPNASPAAVASPGASAPPPPPKAGSSPAAAASPPASAPSASAAPSPAAGKPGPAASPAAQPAPQNAPPGPSPATLLVSEVKPGEAPPYSAAWHHQHLYSPRRLNLDSNMPAYRFLYEKRRISGERSADALALTGADAVPDGWEVVPTYDAKCLVAFLMSRDQSHPLKEVKSATPPAPAAPGKAATK